MNARFIWRLVMAVCVAAALAGCDKPVDPDSVSATWEAQTCEATVKANQNTVALTIPGLANINPLPLNTEYMLVQNTTLTLSGSGQATVDYGGGHKFNLYAPSNGRTEVEYRQWNGTLGVALYAGSGEVIEDTDNCRMDVVAADQVTFVSEGTDYVVIVRPKTDAGVEVQVGVFTGRVRVMTPDQGTTLAILESSRAALVLNGQVSPPFELPAGRETIIRNLQQGADLFGVPLGDVRPAGIRQLDQNLAKNISALNPGLVFVVFPPDQEREWGSKVAPMLDQQGFKFQGLAVANPEDLFAMLQSEVDAGMLQKDSVILALNMSDAWNNPLANFAEEFGLTGRVLLANSFNGQVTTP